MWEKVVKALQSATRNLGLIGLAESIIVGKGAVRKSRKHGSPRRTAARGRVRAGFSRGGLTNVQATCQNLRETIDKRAER